MNEPTRTMTEQQLKQNAEIEARVIAQIEGQNWTDDPLTEGERAVIGMAVAAVLYGVRTGSIKIASPEVEP